ncbi:MAG TPA: MerR family transcriptional regulator [Propionibacteriaceae bacterium]|jgi:DNA-binding transcriptional MerR regulator|nr:MerR family transcriptional regulator [Propionibacteriaceae bacterium]
MRIGEVTRKTGLSARMIPYYEHRGRIRSPSRGPRAHRHYAEDDIERLRLLRALLAAGVSPSEAIDVIDGDVGTVDDAASAVLHRRTGAQREWSSGR